MEKIDIEKNQTKPGTRSERTCSQERPIILNVKNKLMN